LEHEHANTFEAIAKEWLALKDWEQVTKDRRLQMLERVVFPSIGLFPIRQIVPIDWDCLVRCKKVLNFIKFEKWKNLSSRTSTNEAQG